MSFPYCPRGRFLLFESVINNSCLICIEFMLDNSKIKICLQPAAVCGVYAEIRFQLTSFNACSTAIGAPRMTDFPCECDGISTELE